MNATAPGWHRPNVERLRTWFSPSVLLSLAATVYALSVVDITGPAGRFFWALVAAWLGATAGALHAMARGWRLPAGLVLQGACGLAAGGLVLLDRHAGLFLPSLFAGLLLALPAAALPGLRDPEAYWAWCEKFVLATALASAAALIGLLTASGTLWSASHLFGLDGSLGKIAFRWPAAIFACAIGPIALLTLLPTPNASATGGLGAGESDFVRRAVSILAAWALTPFVLIYSALLWLYAAKIALAGALPDGQIGWMVGVFGFTALVAVLLIFPQRDSGPRRVRLLWRFWPWLLIAPFILLALALAERIGAYGLTPGRYMAVLLAALCGANALAAFRGRESIVRFAPAAAAAGFILASFGPWSAISASVSTQAAAARSILAANGLIRDGKIASGGAPVRLSAREHRRWKSALDFLQQNGSLARAAPDNGPVSYARLAELFVDPVKRPTYVTMTSAGDWTAPAELQSHRLVGSFSIAGATRKSFDVGEASIEQQNGRLTIQIRGEQPAIFDYATIVASAGKTGKLPDAPLLRPTEGNGDIVLLLDGFTMTANGENAPGPTWLRAFILTRRKSS